MKKLILSIILTLLATFQLNAAEYLSNPIVTGTAGIYTDSRAYSSLSAAVSSIGASEVDLFIAQNEAVGTLTIPSNIRLHFLKAGAMTIATQLTLQTTQLIAEDQQIFSGAGDIDFASGSVVRSTWFSDIDEALDVTSDDTLIMTIAQTETTTASAAVGNNVTLRWEAPFILTVDTGHVLSNVKNIEAGGYQILAGAGDVDFLDGTRVNLDWFPHLRSAINWIENELVTIEVNGVQTVDYTDTVDANEVLDFSGNGQLSISGGITLTINSEPITGLRQIFSGAGTIDFGDGYFDGAYPQWWEGDCGDGSTDCSASIQAAINAVDGSAAGHYRAVYFVPGIYSIESKITMKTAPLIGKGGMLNSGVRIVWNGSSGVTAFEKDSNAHEGDNSFALVENISFREGANAPSYWLDFSTSTTIDAYHRLKELHFNGCTKSAIKVGAWLNAHWEHLRFDKWGEYCIDFVTPASPALASGTFVLDGFTADARTRSALGLFHVDVTLQQISGMGTFEVSNGRIEINTDLAATNPGIFVYTIPAAANSRTIAFKLRNITYQDVSGCTDYILYRDTVNTTASESITVENFHGGSELTGLVGGTPGSSFNNISLPNKIGYLALSINQTADDAENVFGRTAFAPVATHDALEVQNKDDSQARFVIDNNGYFNWGPGDAATDTRLYRPSADTLRVANGDSLYIQNTWDGGMLRLGAFYIWADTTGDLRIKVGAPANDTDGTIVGTQN